MQNLLNYNDLWIRLSAFFNLPVEERKILLNHLHKEVCFGFDVVTRIALEEIGKNILNKELYSKARDIIEEQLAYSTLSGYILYLYVNDIDPLEDNLTDNAKTSEIGSRYIEEHQKDNTKELLANIDFVITLLLEKATQGRVNQLLVNNTDFNTAMYKDVALIEKFLNWCGHQGYILAILENS